MGTQGKGKYACQGASDQETFCSGASRALFEWAEQSQAVQKPLSIDASRDVASPASLTVQGLMQDYEPADLDRRLVELCRLEQHRAAVGPCAGGMAEAPAHHIAEP